MFKRHHRFAAVATPLPINVLIVSVVLLERLSTRSFTERLLWSTMYGSVPILGIEGRQPGTTLFQRVPPTKDKVGKLC